MYSLAKSTGFSLLRTTEAEIQQVSSPVEHHRTSWAGPDRKEARLRELVKRASQAYITDSLVRQAVDKYAENFREFELSGEEQVVKYLHRRLNHLSLKSGEHWKTTFVRIITEYFKTGNAFILKFRSLDGVEATKALYQDRLKPICKLGLIGAERIVPVFNQSHQFVGWKLEELPNKSDTVELDLGGKSLSRSKSLLELEKLGTTKEPAKCILRPGADIVQISYKKPANSCWGVGLTLVSLEDIALLRTVEQITASMIRKFSNPIIHHIVLRASNPLAGIQSEIDSATRLHRQAAPDGVMITGGNHEIKAIGSESQALRVEGYLKYFLDRGLAGLGVSQAVMGLGSMSMGAAEAANEMLMTKVRFCQQELARELEFFILNELLWEGGFDPYRNEKDRVIIEFPAIDEDREIKLRTHAADLYQKNLTDHDETRKLGKLPPKFAEDKLHVNKIEKAKIDHETKGAVLVNRSKPATSGKNSVEYFRQYLYRFAPREEGDIPDFLEELKWHYPIEKVEPLLEKIRQLINDREAVVELLINELS